MNQDKRFKWVIFLVFATGFTLGQDYHTGFWLVVRFLFQVATVFFVLTALVAPVVSDYIRNQEEQWKAVQFRQKMRRRSSGMARTVATVAEATGTHVTAPRTTPRSPSSGELRAVDHKRPDAGLDG
jgi:hypothetical protein